MQKSIFTFMCVSFSSRVCERRWFHAQHILQPQVGKHSKISLKTKCNEMKNSKTMDHWKQCINFSIKNILPFHEKQFILSFYGSLGINQVFQKGKVSQMQGCVDVPLPLSVVHNIIKIVRKSGEISVHIRQGCKSVLDLYDLQVPRQHCIKNSLILK